jgi:hypothetical protein
MTRHWHPARECVARWLKPSAERFAVAAAFYSPDLMLQLEATRLRGAFPAPPFCREPADGAHDDLEGAHGCPAT